MTFAPDLFLHDTSRCQLEQFINHPSHGLLLHGVEGIGLATTAQTLASILTDNTPTHRVSPTDGKDITIEQVRKLYELTRSSAAQGHAVIIEDADTMGPAAQNSLLKLLEEPPKNTYFIITSHHPERLLDTIKSRTQSIGLLALSQKTSQELVSKHEADHTKRSQILFLGSGRPAILLKLATDPEYFAAQAAAAKDAREFIQSSTYKRLIICSSYMNDRGRAADFLAMLGIVLYHMIKKDPASVAASRLTAVGETLDGLQQNINARLALTYIALSF